MADSCLPFGFMENILVLHPFDLGAFHPFILEAYPPFVLMAYQVKAFLHSSLVKAFLLPSLVIMGF